MCVCVHVHAHTDTHTHIDLENPVCSRTRQEVCKTMSEQCFVSEDAFNVQRYISLHFGQFTCIIFKMTDRRM